MSLAKCRGDVGLGFLAAISMLLMTTRMAAAVPSPPATLSAVQFVDSSVGWAGGSKGAMGWLVSTTDGGVTWNPLTLPAAVTAITSLDFVDRSTGWLVGQASLDPAAPDIVLKTRDGGASWTAEAVPGLSGPARVAFTDTRNGWLIGHTDGHEPGAVRYPGEGAILHTDDGGETWASQSVPPGVSHLSRALFLDPLHGSILATDAAGGVILTTADGGTTWQVSEIPAQTGTVNALAFVDPSHGWAVGTAGTVVNG